MRGGMKAREQAAVTDLLRSLGSDEERVVVATGQFAGEGFDNARLDTLFLALPVSWSGTIVQYAGRIHRLHHAKREVRIIDYMDDAVPMLAQMHEKRLRGYRAMGYSDAEVRHTLQLDLAYRPDATPSAASRTPPRKVPEAALPALVRVLTPEELDSMIDDAIVEAFSADEQAEALFTMLLDELELPFTVRLDGGKEVTVTDVALNGAAVVARCLRGRGRRRVPLERILWAEERPLGWEWVEAFRRWTQRRGESRRAVGARQ